MREIKEEEQKKKGKGMRLREIWKMEGKKNGKRKE